MKKELVTIVFLCIAILSFGQDKFDLDWGLKVGLNNSKITANKAEFNSETIYNFHYGAFARINLGRVYLQPEAYFISKGGDIRDIANENPLQTISSFDYKAVDVPILVGVYILNKEAINVRAMVGPTLSLPTKRDLEGENNVKAFSKEYLKNNFFGWQYGIGVDALFFTFDARIESRSKNIYLSENMKAKKSSLILSLGIKF